MLLYDKKNTYLQYVFWEIKWYINSMVLVAAFRNVINMLSYYPYLFYKMLSVWKPNLISMKHTFAPC